VEPTSVVVAVADHHLRRRRRRRRQATDTTAAHPLRSPHPNPTLLGFLNNPTTRHRETLVARVGQTGLLTDKASSEADSAVAAIAAAALAAPQAPGPPTAQVRRAALLCALDLLEGRLA
jgi:hypothetical protein